MEANALLLLAGLLLSAGSAPPLGESEATHIFLEPIVAVGDEVAAAELHRIADELLVTALSATKKFTLAASAKDPGVELVVRGTLARAGKSYELQLVLRQGDEEERIGSSGKESLEAAVAEVAAAISGRQRRSGYVVKREGSRIVIARGAEEGIAVGQRYRTTDTGEEFEIVRVAPHTADGQITGRTGAATVASRPAATLEGTKLGAKPGGGVGAVDVVFVLDTTESMQEEIDGVLANCRRLVEGLSGSGIDASLTLVTFKVGVEEVKGPTEDAAIFQGWLTPLRADGGGDETPFTAIDRATRIHFRPGARRVFVLITDEPAYDAISSAAAGASCLDFRHTSRDVWDGALAHKVSALLSASHTVVFSVTVDDRKGIYRELAKRTGGTFYDLESSQDFTALLDKLGKRIEGMFIEL